MTAYPAYSRRITCPDFLQEDMGVPTDRGNGTGLSFYIKYAEHSTEDDPTVIAKGRVLLSVQHADILGLYA